MLRLSFIEKVLSRYGFETTTRGDMIDAKHSRGSENETRKLLTRLGYLMAVTRLMDMRMENDEQVDREVEMFINDAENRDVRLEEEA